MADEQERCPDCQVAAGTPHEDGCEHFGWVPRRVCGAVGYAPNGDRLECNIPGEHDGEHADGSRDCLAWSEGELAHG